MERGLNRMNTKGIASFVVAGLMVAAPSVVHAYKGVAISCVPTAGQEVHALIKPGLSCDNAVNKIGVATTIDGCSADLTAPWDAWAAAKAPAKITLASAGQIAKIALKIGAKTFGSCNFAGNPDSFSAGGAGKFILLNATEDVKIGKGAVFGTVGGDLATQSAAVKGFVTKGSLVAAQVSIQIGLDIANPLSDTTLACNTGAICPPTPADGTPHYPITDLALKTNATSFVKIGVPQNSDCTAASSPWACCTGAAAGNCD